MVAAWQVISWPRVYWPVRQFYKHAKKFRHLGTSVQGFGGADSLKHGLSLWGCELDGALFGIAWDWAEVRPEVVALADPMKLLSNIVLLDADRCCMEETKRLLYFNTAVFQLPWQEETGRARHDSQLNRLAA